MVGQLLEYLVSEGLSAPWDSTPSTCASIGWGYCFGGMT